jgi:hypothetical protein
MAWLVAGMVIAAVLCFLLYARGVAKVMEQPFWQTVADILRALKE